MAPFRFSGPPSSYWRLRSRIGVPHAGLFVPHTTPFTSLTGPAVRANERVPGHCRQSARAKCGIGLQCHPVPWYFVQCPDLHFLQIWPEFWRRYFARSASALAPIRKRPVEDLAKLPGQVCPWMNFAKVKVFADCVTGLTQPPINIILIADYLYGVNGNLKIYC